MPSAISPQLPSPRLSSVATTAIPIPTAAMRLPRTAVVGPERPRSPWMNSAKATMYRTSRKLVFCRKLARTGWITACPAFRRRRRAADGCAVRSRAVAGPGRGLAAARAGGLGLGLEHLQHAIGDEEAADDV